MIDHVKINNLRIGADIQNYLDFELKTSQQTGEVLTFRKRSAYLENLRFTLTPEQKIDQEGHIVDLVPKSKFSGSLHRYANNGDNNYDRFTFERFLRVACSLKDYISSDDNINVLEFGVNIHTPFNPSNFVNYLICHLKKPFNKTIASDISYAEVKHTHFILKIYDKGLHQGPRGANILRVEVRYRKMQRLFPKGLKWADLSNKRTWQFLGEVLQQKFKEVIYFDPSIILKQVPERDRTIIERGYNPIYWEHLSGPHVSRERAKYQKLISQYGNEYNTLLGLLMQEIKDVVNCSHFSACENRLRISVPIDDGVNCSPLLYENISPGGISLSSRKSVCIVTGIDISMQKETSRFLSISGIRFIESHNPALFSSLQKKLSPKWQNASLEKQIREIAHSIRNAHHSKRIHTKKAIERLCTTPALFNNYDLVCEPKKRIANQL